MSTMDRILFVDDDPLSRRAFARSMRQLGFIVDVADNGQEALRLARYYPYAVVAADWYMPDLDGLALLAAVRGAEREPVCVLVTGASDAALAQCEVDSMGVAEIVRKPWGAAELAAVLRRAVDTYHRSTRQPTMLPPSRRVELSVLLIGGEESLNARIDHLLADSPDTRYRVTFAATFKHGIEALEARCFDAVLLSLELPECPGIDAVRRVVAARPGTPTIAVSQIEDEDLALMAVQGGAQDCLSYADLRPVSLRRSIAHAIERKRAEERLTHLANHDQLTGLANRMLLGERLEQALLRARRRETLVAVLFLDLDRFKAINDSLGHDAGDELLRQVSARLRGSVRDTDTVARMGGDEFAVVVEELERAEEATLLAQRVLNSFATPFRLSSGEVETSTSIGIGVFPHNGVAVEALLKCADSAMYRAKATGRNNYQFFSEALHAQSVRQIQLENELRIAVADEAFVLHFQPQVSLRDFSLVGVEALLRWRTPGGALVPPAEFMPALEATGLIVPVGEWALRRACSQVRAWNTSGDLKLRASVNISPRQFEDAGFIHSVKKVLTDLGMQGNELELEVTESLLMRDSERNQLAFEELRQLGVRIAIDDFGTGYTSLTHFKRAPIDSMKIDRSFLDNVNTDDNAAALAAAVIALGRSLGVSVTAEGVETPQQMAFLRKHGCDIAQGFLIAHPSDAPTSTQWLSQTINATGCWTTDLRLAG